MTFSQRTVAGLGAGVIVGLFLGDRAAVLDWPAKAFVQLLQVTVLPYLVISLVVGIAGQTPQQAKRLARTGGVILLCLWLISLALVFMSPAALPADKGGLIYSTRIAAEEPVIDWLDLYIPANPFRSLANNVVPAVVVFSALLGVALLTMPDKERLLTPLRLVSDLLARAGALVVRLTPLGIFAIAGHAAGTLRIEELERLQAFLLVWVGLSLILTLWILPGLVSVVTGARHGRIVGLAWDPMVTAFVTANLFVVLPLLQERAKQLLAELPLDGVQASDAVDVLVPTSFTLPHSAKLLSLAFILFAGWYSGSPVGVGQYGSIAVVGWLSLFGSLNSAMPFLLDLVRLPADLFQLFLMSSVINGRFGSAAAAMHTLALAVLGAWIISGQRRRLQRVPAFIGKSVLIVGVFLIATRLFLGAVLPGPERATAMFDRLQLSGLAGRLATLDTTDGDTADSRPAGSSGNRLDRIAERGTLRACVSPDALPWCYRNRTGDIVGFEADLVHAIAVELNVRLRLVAVERVRRPEAISSGVCDVAIGRVTPSEAGVLAFSRPLVHERWAFLVTDDRRNDFATAQRIQELPTPRIAVLATREWVEQLQSWMPTAIPTPVGTIQEFLDAPPGRFDGMFTGFQRAAAHSLVSPRFSAVLTPGLGSVPIAIAVPKGEESLVDFANAFVDVGTANGLIEQKLAYWVYGDGARERRAPRWSIGGNVLGWWAD